MANDRDDKNNPKKPDRRKLIINSGAFMTYVGVAATEEGCKPRVGAEGNTLASEADYKGKSDLKTWLDSVDPISTVKGPLTNFMGDEPFDPHKLIRDAQLKPSDLGGQVEEFSCVVIGGGMSGLGSAFLLRQMGKEICVLEAASRFGGNAKGEAHGSLQYSIGAAYMLFDPESNLQKAFYTPLGLEKIWRVVEEKEEPKNEKDQSVIDEFEKNEGEPVEIQGRISKGFWFGNSILDEKERAQYRKQFRDMFFYLKDGTIPGTGAHKQEFPNIPPVLTPGQAMSDDSRVMMALDSEDLMTHLTRVVGSGNDLHPHIRTWVEHYCWSSMGGSATEISAAGGLNFLMGEFQAPVAGLPGGNSQVACQLLRGIVGAPEQANLGGTVPKENMRTKHIVRNVKELTAEKKLLITYYDDKGALRTMKSKFVIMACPKFVAKYLYAPMGADKSPYAKALAGLEWRSYFVANVIVNEPMDLTRNGGTNDFFDLYMLDTGDTVAGVQKTEEWDDALVAESDKQRATDLVQGSWVQQKSTGDFALKSADKQKVVLTMYKGFPYSKFKDEKGEVTQTRKKIIPYPAAQAYASAEGMTAYTKAEEAMYQKFSNEFKAQANVIMNGLGLKSRFAVGNEKGYGNPEMRLARWGHPIVLAKKGLYKSGAVAAFQQPTASGRIYFANQDNWALPAIETCLNEAITVAKAIANKLGLRLNNL